MRLYLYALAAGLADAAGLRGVAQEPLVVIEAGDAVAVGGWIDELPAVSRDVLASQDRVVRALHDRALALLPMRFATWKSDEPAVVRAVNALGPDLAARLDLVRGRDQMTLRIVGRLGGEGPEPAPPVRDAEPNLAEPPGAGARYLSARAARVVPPALAALLDPLRPLTRATRTERGRGADVVATVYHLIDRQSDDAYRRAVHLAAGNTPSLTVRITGPSPAYAFAAIDLR